MRIPEGEEREKGIKEMFKPIMTENFPQLMSNAKPQVQEAQRTPIRINVKKKKTTPTTRYTIFKLKKNTLAIKE